MPPRGRRRSTVWGRCEGLVVGLHPTELLAQARCLGNARIPPAFSSGRFAPMRAGHPCLKDAPFPGRRAQEHSQEACLAKPPPRSCLAARRGLSQPREKPTGHGGAVPGRTLMAGSWKRRGLPGHRLDLRVGRSGRGRPRRRDGRSGSFRAGRGATRGWAGRRCFGGGPTVTTASPASPAGSRAPPGPAFGRRCR